MRVAFLGCDDGALALAAALARDERFELAEAFSDGPYRSKIGEFCEHVHRSDEWPALLGPLGVDVVVVGRERDDAAGPEPLRRLAQLGIPLVLPHPLGGPLLALELDMIRRDTGARLIPHYPGCRHPAVGLLRELVGAAVASSLGTIEQLVFERAMSNRRREAVAEQLTRDAGLIQSILGPLNKVTAQGPAPDADSWSNLNVHLAGESGVLARWAVEPSGAKSPPGDDWGCLSLVGSQGRAVLEMPSDRKQWRLEVYSGDQRDGAETGRDSGAPVARDFSQWDEAQGTIAAILGTSLSTTFATTHSTTSATTQGESNGPAWSAVCRELELVDAVEVSLRKRRTIELHHETVTEEDTFKGLMSAVGCLLVLIVPLVLIGVAVADGLLYQPTTTLHGEPIAGAEPSSLRRFWPVLLAAPLIAFLLMQTLRFVFPGTPRDSSRPGSRRESHEDPRHA